MSNFKEQSLDENAVFLPVDETSPKFLHSERERLAVERLLSSGPEAFYSSIGTECSSSFLSPVEVRQITSWAQDYRHSQVQVQQEENGQDGNSVMEDFSSTYFPSHTDTPPPDLELGWPEKSPWVPMGNITVYTSPPAEGEPHVREIVREHLQRAMQVIAIVTDRLTDDAIIGDLHNAASRGVPVYIILNQRSIQENFTLNRLRHPNMRVRVLGGKTFCSREGRMVVGNLKDKFLLVDLQTVIHGSYSFTWTDAHLHRQMVTVLSGPVVDSFDKEFRILFAASLPVSDTWTVATTHVAVALQLKDTSEFRFGKHLALEHEITNPPSPPVDSPLDWEAMGVIQRESRPDSSLGQREEIMRQEMPQQSNMLFEDHKRRIYNASPVANMVPDKSRALKAERNEGQAMQLFKEKDTNADDRTRTRLDEEERESTQKMLTLPSAKGKKCSWRKPFLPEEGSMDETNFKVEHIPFSRKPLILMMPESERKGPVSEILKRLLPQQSTSGQIHAGSKGAKSELSRSMMDLSVHNADTNQNERGEVPVPRLKGSCFNPGYMTPALALMKKRNDEVKSVLYGPPQSFLPRERPRSATFGLDLHWRRSLAEREGEREGEQE